MNVRAADAVIINKVNTARSEDIALVRKNVEEINPNAKIIDGISTVEAEDLDMIKGKKVLVIEDGPTVTHGGMKYGAGMVAAKDVAGEIVDPRPFAVGSIKEMFKKYTHLTNILPAIGYGKKQISELEETINNTDCEVVVSGTPININRVLKSTKPIVRIRYSVGETTAKELEDIVDKFLKTHNLL